MIIVLALPVPGMGNLVRLPAVAGGAARHSAAQF